ncbi:MAG: PRD domain-containing protein [Eubacteriales bacterium]
MIELTDRQKHILQDLVNLGSPIAAKDLAKKFNISVRTIRYDTDAIEHFLNKKGYTLMKKPNQGIWIELTHQEKEMFRSIVKNQCSWERKILSKEERQYEIQLMLLKAGRPLTAEAMSNDICVSRTTIMKDLKQVKQEIQKYNLSLKSKPRIGYIVTGEENRVREYLVNMLIRNLDKKDLLQILTNKVEGNEVKQSKDFILDSLSGLSDTVKIKDIKEAISSGKMVCNFWIPDSSYVSLIVHIAVNIDRLLKGQNIVMANDRVKAVKDYKEYKIAEKIGQTLAEMYDVTLPDSEIANITVHLLSADLKLRCLYADEMFDNKISLKEVVDKMVSSTEQFIELDEKNILKLKEDILDHIKFTFKKYCLNIHQKNPLLDQIKTKYYDCFELANNMANVFKEMTDIEMPESEIGYIALHIVAQKEILRQSQKKRALVVCTTGKGSAKILAYRIRSSIPNIDIVDIISIFELEENKKVLDDIDFVISTVGLVLSDIPVIKVSPLVDNAEINRIKKFIYNDNTETHKSETGVEQYILNSIMATVGKYVSILDNQMLKTELEFMAEFIVNNLANRTNRDTSHEEYSQRLAFMLVEVNEMIKDIEKQTQITFSLDNIWGLVIHLIMAMPRWESDKFNKEIDLGKYRREYQELYQIIESHLNIIAKKQGILIPEGEIIAIMRYLI